MRRKTRLIINFAIVCLITALIVRDRSINEVFEIVIRGNESSIVIPGYQVACQETDPLRCEISIDNLPLVVAEGTAHGSCQATYGKQIFSCERIRASAADSVSIEGLHLSREQQKRIKAQIWVRSIASLRVMDEGVSNGVLLQLLLGILSILSGIHVSEFFYFRSGLIYPRQNILLKLLVALIGGFGVFLFLSIYFLLLLMVFGYVG
jgi:hypothetical protein